MFVFCAQFRNRVTDLNIPAYLERPIILGDSSDPIMEYYLYVGAEVELRDFFYYGGYLHLNALPIVHRLPFNFYRGYMYLLDHYQRGVVPTDFFTDALENILNEIDGELPIAMEPQEDEEARWADFDALFNDLFADMPPIEGFEFNNEDEAIDYTVSPILDLAPDAE